MLAFLNSARNATDIAAKESPLRDDPTSGTGAYRIGETVARRILERRESLSPPYFRSLDQLHDIEGLGKDKFHDLVYTFCLPATDEFVRRMYAGVIDARWKLEHVSLNLESPEVFRALANDPDQFRNAVQQLLYERVKPKARTVSLARELSKKLLCGVEVQAGMPEKVAEFEWALWFYRIGERQFFAFDQVREEISRYFNTYSGYDNRIEWRVLRGFRSENFLRSSVPDLPVTLNYAERTLSLWQVEGIM